jgi:hypothetical protein
MSIRSIFTFRALNERVKKGSREGRLLCALSPRPAREAGVDAHKGMCWPLRMFQEEGLCLVTSSCFQGGLLLRPSARWSGYTPSSAASSPASTPMLARAQLLSRAQEVTSSFGQPPFFLRLFSSLLGFSLGLGAGSALVGGGSPSTPPPSPRCQPADSSLLSNVGTPTTTTTTTGWS